MKSKDKLSGLVKTLRLNHISVNIENLIFKAQEDKPSYIEFLTEVFEKEIIARKEKEYYRRFKSAKLPLQHDLDDFNYNFSCGMPRTHMDQLRELTWMEQ